MYPVLVAVWIPVHDVEQLVGQCILREGLHHWDCAGMSPMVLEQSGFTLGAEASVLYGIGVGKLLAWVSETLGGLDYAGAFRIAVRDADRPCVVVLGCLSGLLG